MMHPKGRIREIFWKELSEHEKTYKPLYNTYSRIRNTHIYTDVQNPFCLWEVWSVWWSHHWIQGRQIPNQWSRYSYRQHPLVGKKPLTGWSKNTASADKFRQTWDRLITMQINTLHTQAVRLLTIKGGHHLPKVGIIYLSWASSTQSFTFGYNHLPKVGII